MHYKLSPQEFIKHAFTPNIAVLHSSTVDKICQKNFLSFIELLQPFSTIDSEAHIQDGVGGEIYLQNLKITLSDVNAKPSQPSLAHKILSICVSSATEPHTESIQAGNHNLKVPAYAPWFESWRTSFLNLQYPSDHEFTKHYLACILIVSSSDNNPIEMMNQLGQTLSQLQTTAPNKYPKWFKYSVLRYYCVVHDNMDGDKNKATESLEAFKISFGPNNCFLLQLNSRPMTETDHVLPDLWNEYISPYYDTTATNRYSPDASPSSFRAAPIATETHDDENALPYHPLSPNTELFMDESPTEQHYQQNSKPHGICLTTEDIDEIKLFLNEFCTQAFFPYVERLVQNLNDLLSNKKGVGKSLFTATKRWFTPGKMGSSNGGSNLLIYPYEAPELQFRRLGDLYFMFGHYNLAYQVYHACKQDFSADQAWFYYAGVLEMASLAAFMANECSRKTFDYIEEAILSYLNTCKMAQFATRATLFSAECLKFRNLFGEAAHQLIRMTSEDSDLQSALLLEQAAFCFLDSSNPQMVRKYAFHMVLSGHRFSKSAQKRHALRCYKQALQVYCNSRWSFAEDHMYYTIGKLSTILGNHEDAIKSFALLLTVQSKQSVKQQTLFLEEYLSIQRMLLNDQDYAQKSELLLPVLKFDTIKILVGPAPPLSIPRKVRALGISFDSHDNPTEIQMWNKLEEMIIQEAQGSLPITFKVAVVLYTKHNLPNTKVDAVVNELIQVSVVIHNPLSVPLILQDVYLLWNFKDENGILTSNENMDTSCNLLLKTHVLKSFLAQSNNFQDLILSVTPLIVGKLQLKGISYSIYNSYNSEDIVFVTGKQYFNVQQLGLLKDTVLEISITPPAPCLQVTFSEIRSEILCDEIQLVQMEMRNAGHVPLHKVYIASSKPQFLSTCEFHNDLFEFKQFDESDGQEREAAKNHVYSVPLPKDCLDPGRSHSVNIWLKAPKVKGHINIDLLIYYENSNSDNDSRYRLIRHTWKLIVHKSLEVLLKVVEGCKAEKYQELLFIAQVTNANKKYQNSRVRLFVTNVILLSSLWKLEPISNYTRSLLLNSRQSTHVLLKGTRYVTDGPNFSEVTLSDNWMFKNKMAYLDFGRRLMQNILNAFDETKPNLTTRVEGVLLFHWTAVINSGFGQESKSNGQTCVFIEKTEQSEHNQYQEMVDVTNDEVTIEPRMTELGQEVGHDTLHMQISLCLIYDDFVYHDFRQSNSCIIPIKIILHNDSLFISLVSIRGINTAVNDGSSHFLLTKPSLCDPQPSKNFWWVAANTVTKSVAPLSSEKILFNIAVTSPGVYDLGSRLEVWCQNELHDDPILQIMHISSFITVQNV